MTSQGLHLTNLDWDEAALQSVVKLGQGVARTVCIARALVDNGRIVDLAGLDRGVGLVCAKALDLPYQQGRGMREHLAALLGEVDSLTESLRRSQEPADRR